MGIQQVARHTKNPPRMQAPKAVALISTLLCLAGALGVITTLPSSLSATHRFGAQTESAFTDQATAKTTITTKIWAVLSIAYPNRTFTPGSGPGTFTPQVVDATGSLSYALSGTLPTGGEFNTATGAITVADTGLDVISELSVGSSHSAFTTDRGRMYVWGLNSYGQLGNGTTSKGTASAPVEVAALADRIIIQTAVGTYHTVALDSTGRVYAWGLNSVGQLGDGTTSNRNLPTEVTALSGKKIIQIFAYGSNVFALDDQGRVYSWGSNPWGQLGDGTTTNRATPVEVTALAGMGVTQISGHATATFAVASGRVYAWGSNGRGQLGDGTTISHKKPVEMATLAGKTIVQIGASSAHTAALDSAGRVYTWGSNSDGALGDGTTVDRYAPALVSALAGKKITQISVGNNFMHALDAGGLVFGWGNNASGRLGDGTRTARLTPVEATILAGKSVSRIVPTANHTYVLEADRTIHFIADLLTTVQRPVPGWPFTVTVTAKDSLSTATTGPITFSLN